MRGGNTYSVDDSDTQGAQVIVFDDGQSIGREMFAEIRDNEGEVTHWLYESHGVTYIIWND